MQHDINKLQIWLETNKLELNIQKLHDFAISSQRVKNVCLFFIIYLVKIENLHDQLNQHKLKPHIQSFL